MSFMNLISRLANRTTKPKVFGIGTLRTGTTSLGTALEILGYKHTHERRNALLRYVKAKNLSRVYRWVDQHDSFEDWPWPLIYRELDERYPNSRFILTVRRDDESWLKSIVKYSRFIGPSPGRKMFFGYSMPAGHEAEYVARYREHNRSVQDYFKGRPGKLLVVCWENGDEWQKLCRFLGVRVPNAGFPRRNTGTKPIRK